ncbi:MAG: YbaB/EbfC family nucleoid-associated protein [Desulfobacteraceae bacterium]
MKGKGMPNMGNILKQAQQFQSKMAKLQEELGEKTVEATSGGGMVTVVANGKQEIVSIRIEPEVVDPEDVDMLQDLIQAAVNDAMTRAKEMVNEEMGKLTSGMNLPNIPGLM